MAGEIMGFVGSSTISHRYFLFHQQGREEGTEWTQMKGAQLDLRLWSMATVDISSTLLASHTKGTFGHFNLKAIILVSELEIPNKRQISVVPLSRGAWYFTLNTKPLYLGAKPKVAWKISCGKMTVVKNTPNSIGLENRRPTMYMTGKTSAKQKFWPTQLVDEVSEGPL